MSNDIVAQGSPYPHVTNVVTTGVVPQGPRIRESYPTRTSIVLGSVQIISGVVAVIFGILGLAWGSYFGSSAYGIWCGIPIIGGGIAGVCAGKTKNEQAIMAFLVMSIIDVCVAGLMGIIALVAVINDKNDIVYIFFLRNSDYHTRRVVTSSMLLGTASVAAIACLWSSIVAGNCCNSTPTASYTAVTTHTDVAGQTQMPVYPQQPQMQYAYNGPAQPQYGAPMPPQPPQTVQPPQYGGPPECFAKPPPYDVPLIDIN